MRKVMPLIDWSERSRQAPLPPSLAEHAAAEAAGQRIAIDVESWSASR